MFQRSPLNTAGTTRIKKPRPKPGLERRIEIRRTSMWIEPQFAAFVVVSLISAPSNIEVS